MPYDENDPAPLDPTEEDRVRRLLAEARHVGTVPDDVAERLDAALVRLVDERTAREADRAALVVELAARRRRRRIGAALVAAAATVVLGVSLSSLNGGLTVGGGDGGEAGTAHRESAAQERQFKDDDGGGSADDTPPPPEAAEAPLMAPTEISADRFKRDATAARDQAPTYELSTRAAACVDVPSGAAQVVPVRYAGRDGLLVFGDPAGDRQRVDLYLCPDGELVRSATVPAP